MHWLRHCCFGDFSDDSIRLTGKGGFLPSSRCLHYGYRCLEKEREKNPPCYGEATQAQAPSHDSNKGTGLLRTYLRGNLKQHKLAVTLGS